MKISNKTKEKVLENFKSLANAGARLGIAPDDFPDDSLMSRISSASREFRYRWDNGLETREDVYRTFKANYIVLERETLEMCFEIRKGRIISGLRKFIHDDFFGDVIAETIEYLNDFLYFDSPKIYYLLENEKTPFMEVEDILAPYEDQTEYLRKNMNNSKRKKN